MIPVYTATEDDLSEVLADRILEPWSDCLLISVRMRRRGYGYLKSKLPELLKLARNVPVVVLTDLDQTECAPKLIDDWFKRRHKPDQLLFRVAVREAESWLMADHAGFSAYFGVPEERLPSQPEELSDPKASMLSVLSRYAPRAVRADMVTRIDAGLRQGLAYNARCREFVQNHWNPDRAVARCDSLARANRRIEELALATAGG